MLQLVGTPRSRSGKQRTWTWCLTSGRRTKHSPHEQRLSKNQIHKKTGIPYTTVCECLSGRRGGGKHGKIAGGKRMPKILNKGTSG